ncbi:MAG: hypothetical protein KAV87_20945 [Desulfobacteraceae bacterium]|nr:hypothetical protein [Desulfobacteraceae bacterium]
MDEWSGKESYQGYYKKVELIVIERLNDGIEKLKLIGVDIDALPGYRCWADDNTPELIKEEREILNQMNNLWLQGEAAVSFDDKHFHRYEVVVRDWGSVTNKIFNRYFKALEVTRRLQLEREESEKGSRPLVEQEEVQAGMGF